MALIWDKDTTSSSLDQQVSSCIVQEVLQPMSRVPMLESTYATDTSLTHKFEQL
jgi:hypothetical protein